MLRPIFFFNWARILRTLLIQHIELRSYPDKIKIVTHIACSQRPSHPYVLMLLYFDNKQRLLTCTSQCIVLYASERNIAYLKVSVRI